jgi:hypothetical protein
MILGTEVQEDLNIYNITDQNNNPIPNVYSLTDEDVANLQKMPNVVVIRLADTVGGQKPKKAIVQQIVFLRIQPILNGIKTTMVPFGYLRRV